MVTMYEKLLELGGNVQPWVYNVLGIDTPYVNYYIKFPNGYGASLIKHPPVLMALALICGSLQ